MEGGRGGGGILVLCKTEHHPTRNTHNTANSAKANWLTVCFISETFFEKVDFSYKSTINTFITDKLQLNEPSRNAVCEVVKKLCEQLQRTFSVNKFVKVRVTALGI